MAANHWSFTLHVLQIFMCIHSFFAVLCMSIWQILYHHYSNWWNRLKNACAHVYNIMQGFLFKCLGVIMRKVTQRQFIQKILDSVFSTIKHSNQVEREVCVYNCTNCTACLSMNSVLFTERVLILSCANSICRAVLLVWVSVQHLTWILLWANWSRLWRKKWFVNQRASLDSLRYIYPWNVSVWKACNSSW